MTVLAPPPRAGISSTSSPSRRNRHGDREPACRRNEQPGAVVGRRIVDGGIGVSVLADDGDLRMPPGRGFRQLDVHVGKVAHIREHPDLGLAGLAFDDRLELAVDRELHVALVVGERRIRRNIRVGVAGRRGEALQIAGDELEAPAIVADRERPRVPDREVFLSRLGLG